jgi:Ni,Fe-hydrogenase I cytochrome b subunit
VNVWLDVVFTTLICVVGIALPIHFGISFFNGRFRNSWIEGNWPHHDGPHPPPLPKVLHFVHLAMMVVLAFTGMYVRFPFFDGGRTTMRWIHYVAMTIVGIVFVWRIWYAFFSSRRDWKEFAIGQRDLKSALGIMMYYAYLSNNKPHVAKYNVMQKMSYDLFAILMVVQGFTGLTLIMTPFLFGYSPRYWLTFWWADLIGGVAMAGAWMRIVHYVCNWLFIIMTTIHVYLAATADIPTALDFFGIEYSGKVAWRDDPGHADSHGGHDAPEDHGSHDEGPAPGTPAVTESY